MIRINLYDYQRVLIEEAVKKGVVLALVMLLAGMVLTGFSYLMDQAAVASATQEAQVLETQVNQLEPQFKAVQALKSKQTDLRAKIKSLADLRSGKIPFARLLEDVGELMPTGLWLDKMSQAVEDDLKKRKIPILFLDPDDPSKPKAPPKPGETVDEHLFIEFKGKAESDRDVAHFMEQVEMLEYLDHVILYRSLSAWVGKEPVREFIVYAHVVGSGPQPK